MHCAGDAEEVNKDCPSQPNPGFVKQSLAVDDLLHDKGCPDQPGGDGEYNLVPGEHRRPLNRTHCEFGLGLDELGH